MGRVDRAWVRVWMWASLAVECDRSGALYRWSAAEGAQRVLVSAFQRALSMRVSGSALCQVVGREKGWTDGGSGDRCGLGWMVFNSLISSLVQLVFPWELSNLGNSLTFFIFGFIAFIGFFVLLKILPETKGKSLEELELSLKN